jgi:DNA-binding response OmpR family regulator
MTDLPHILVVDDEADSAEGVRFTLEKNDFRVSVVYTSDAAFRFLEKELPDLILLDVVMPDIPGIEFCKAIKLDNRFKTIPVVLISGIRVSAEDRLMALSSGASEYLARPVKPGEMVSSLRKAIANSRDREDQAAASREMASFQSMSNEQTKETAVIYNGAPLKREYPESFQRLLVEYNQLLDKAIEFRFFLVEKNLHDRLTNLAGNLGFLKAGARDIIDLHRQCIVDRMDKAHPKEQRVILEESRLMLIELMGYLINYYRRKSI